MTQGCHQEGAQSQSDCGLSAKVRLTALQAVNTASDTASETLYGGVPTSHKEQNKSVAKDTVRPRQFGLSLPC